MIGIESLSQFAGRIRLPSNQGSDLSKTMSVYKTSVSTILVFFCFFFGFT